MFRGTLLYILIPLIHGSMGFEQLCQRDDTSLSDCVQKLLIFLKPWIKKGIPEIGFPSFDPLVLNNTTVSHSLENANFTWILNNSSMYYLHNYDVISVGQNGEIVSLDLKLDQMFATFDYKSTGEVLNTPVNGEGHSKEWYGPIYVTIHIKHNIVNDNEIELCNIADIKFQFDIKNMHVNVRGLHEQEDDVHELFNDGSEEILKVMNIMYDWLFEDLTKQIFIAICKQIPSARFNI
ncbi:hypothetical protein FQR65_LT08333 [Abscondita terminalis]|nr:hypothetical protein FQR65_LT08333 [Abscondita terminalis]